MFWSAQKDAWLRGNRNLSFERVKAEIDAGRFVGPEDNPSRPGQKRVVVRIDGYPVTVPFVVMEGGGWFLKTAYHDRKMKGRI